MKMQAVILAGGRGERLRPITYKIPKVMIGIDERPFLLYLLRFLRKKGISKILLLVGYLGEQIKGYFGNGRKFGLEITYSYEHTPLGTAGALKKAEKLLHPQFLLLFGDTYLDVDYRALIQKFKELDCKGIICVYPNKDKKLPPNLLLTKDNIIAKYSKTNSNGLRQVDAGVGIFKKEILKLIPKETNISLENKVYKKLIEERKLYAFPVAKKFLDIGSFKDLQFAKHVLK